MGERFHTRKIRWGPVYPVRQRKPPVHDLVHPGRGAKPLGGCRGPVTGRILYLEGEASAIRRRCARRAGTG